MPIVTSSTYRPPLGFWGGHVQTVYPTFFRRVEGVRYERERIPTPDGDFLDLDWSVTGARRMLVICHGLEGSARGHYVRGLVRAACRRGWDALAWNYRGCSGEPNRTLRFYHSGATDDLETVLSHAARRGSWDDVALVGFSLGGNLVLKYLGERDVADGFVRRAVAFSVPCDLAAASERLAHWSNALYMRRFLRSLDRKISAKERLIENGQVVPTRADSVTLGTGLRPIAMRTFREFDDCFTAPLHGFASAEDYWHRCSSKQFLPRISIPTLLVNARNDPFLPPSCFPWEHAEQSRHLHLETPRWGGHVGFMLFNPEGEYWSEKRALDFLEPSPAQGVTPPMHRL